MEASKDKMKKLRIENTEHIQQLTIQAISDEQDPGYVVDFREPVIQDKNRNTRKNIKIATWNVRGCAHPRKRDEIDEALNVLEIDIVGIQETHLSEGNSETNQYNWWNAGSKEGVRESRGISLVISKKCDITVSEFNSFSDSVCSMKVIWKNVPITIINTHISSETDPRNKMHLAEVNRALSEARPINSILLIGDLNAHFGIADKEKKEDKRIGSKLKHQTTNGNGNYMKMLMNIFNLTLHNSWSQSNTVLTTWSNGTSESQLDHILSTYKLEAINYIKAKWISTVESDHKILYGVLMGEELEERMKTNPIGPKKRKWHISALNDPDLKEKFQSEINIAMNQSDVITNHPQTIEDKWEVIKETISEAANNTLTVQRSPTTPRRRKTIATQKRIKYLRHSFPQEEEYRIDLKMANKSRKEADRKHFLEKCSKFIQNLESVHPNQRLKDLFKLIKSHNLIMRERKAGRYIPMSKWEEILYKEIGSKAKLIKETDNKPLPPPPSKSLVTKWIRAGRKGRAPGIDNINLELLTHAPTRIIDEIVKLFREAWEKNEVPIEWNTSLQIPIPKNKNPKGTTDYRRISLCSIMYKLYTKYILHCLNDILPDTPSYQAAYLPERSTDDHTFTVGRILEERWKGGLKTYVVALDLEKAFDSVSHEAIISILKHRNVPHKMINRIIKSSLNEDTMIQWCGQRSKKILKGVGVKQGCPLSPRLFNLAIDEVLQTAAEVLPFINLQQEDRTTLPVILVFADDILLIADYQQELQELINELTGLFASIGLKLNSQKCQMLIRDPLAIVPQMGNIQIEGKIILTVKSLKYLGITITSSLNRKQYVRERIKKAYATAHTILPFLQRNRLPWNLTRSIYEMTIVPIVTYGLKTSVLTKANRNSLRAMERDLVKLLASTCNPEVGTLNTNILLRRKTIIRKITLLRIRYWGHIIRRTEGHMLRTVMTFQTKKRKIGRPCLTWISSLEEDKKKFETLEVDWPQILLDKNKTVTISKEIFTIPDKSDTEDEDPEKK